MNIKLPRIICKGASKVLSMALKAKTGYSANILLNEFQARVKNGQAHAHIDIDADMPRTEFEKITGFSADIVVDKVQAQVKDGRAYAHINISADMSQTEFEKLLDKLKQNPT